MTIKEFYDRLYKINKNLTIVRKGSKPVRIFFSDYHAGNPDIYNFETGEFNLANCEKYIPDDTGDVADLIDDYSCENHIDGLDDQWKEILNDKISLLTIGQSDNPFKKYTDHLAKILQEKNKAYGDSFTQSVDDYGLKVIGIRLSDKYNRIKHLVNHGLLKQNDESLEDTLLDMAGYSILSLKYLKEHKKELEDEN